MPSGTGSSSSAFARRAARERRRVPRHHSAPTHAPQADPAPLLAGKAAAWRAAQLVGALHRHSARFVAGGTIEPGLARWAPLGRHTFELALAGVDATQAFWLYAGAED